MRILASVIVSFALTAPALAQSFSQQDGRWACRPDQGYVPQVLVDFDEGLYRRCDESTCTEYHILSATGDGNGKVRIAFTKASYFEADTAGVEFAEFLTVGPRTIVSRGSCEFMGSDAQ